MLTCDTLAGPVVIAMCAHHSKFLDQGQFNSDQRPIRFALLLLSLLVLATVSGFTAGQFGGILGNLAASFVLLAGVASMYRQRLMLIIGLILLAPAISTRWLLFWLGTPILAPVSLTFWLIFTAFNAGALFLYIRARGAFSNDTIYGGICIYVLLGYCFAAAFALLETLSPGSFSFPSGRPESLVALELETAYFSFVTLTTLGYGDVTPLSSQAKSLVMLETVVGPMFVAVFIAQLVGARSARP